MNLDSVCFGSVSRLDLYVLSFFKKGDTIQGGTLFKGGHYLRKYGIFYIHFVVSPTDSTMSKGK